MLDMQWNHKTAQQVRQSELTQAEEARRHHAELPANGGPNLLQTVLNRTGKTLTALGNRLQDRYGSIDEKQPERPKNYRLNAS